MDLKLAVLIDGDNIPSAYVKGMMEESKVWQSYYKKNIWRLDKSKINKVEESPPRKCYNTNSTIWIYNRKKCDRFRNDY